MNRYLIIRTYPVTLSVLFLNAVWTFPFLDYSIFTKAGSLDLRNYWRMLDPKIYTFAGMNATTVLVEFKIWKLLIYHFAHFGLIHYAYTALLIGVYLRAIERDLGSKVALSLYFLSTWTVLVVIPLGWLLLVLFNDEYDWYLIWNGEFIGASVAIYGLAAAYSTYAWKKNRQYFWFLVLNTFLTIARKPLLAERNYVADIGHVGASLIMIPIGYYLLRREESSVRSRIRQEEKVSVEANKEEGIGSKELRK